MPLGVPIPPSPAASEALLAAFAERGIHWYPERLVQALDADRKTGTAERRDRHALRPLPGRPRASRPGRGRGVRTGRRRVGAGGPPDPRDRLRRRVRRRRRDERGDAEGGRVRRGTGRRRRRADRRPSCGAVPSRSSTTVAACATSPSVHDLVARVEVTFMAGRAPDGVFEGPSQALSDQKAEFGTSRIRRWFDRTWTAEDQPVP